MARVKPNARVLVLLGTRKGAFIVESYKRRKTWKTRGPFLEGSSIFHLSFDKRDGKTIYAAVNSGHFGPTVQTTKNFGKTWENAKTPPRFAEGSGLSVENVWHVEPGRAGEPDTVYAGVAPGGLFRSDDGGDNWSLNENLNNHPSRPDWAPGAGGLCLHSIVLDPQRKSRMYVGISAVGVFRSDDAGKSWHLKNKNVRAEFLPNKYREFGQCVHKLLIDPKNPKFLYQQNHSASTAQKTRGTIGSRLPRGYQATLASHWQFTHTIRGASMLPLNRGRSSALWRTNSSTLTKPMTPVNRGRNVTRAYPRGRRTWASIGRGWRPIN